MTLSTVVVTKPCCIRPSFTCSGAPMALLSLFPFQRSLHPLVDETHDQDQEEDHHGDKAEQADLIQHHGPGKEERDLQVEQDEQYGDQVVAHVELHARVLEGFEAAFIG